MKSRHRYRVICKVQLKLGVWIFRKFYTSDLIMLRRWIVKHYNDYAYINVYANQIVGIIPGQKVGSITKKSILTRAQQW
jgi:hypothetical protein